MNLKAFLLKRIARKSYGDEFTPEQFRTILIVRPAKIGDTICLFPLIRELKRCLPAAEIDVYASTNNNFMFRYMPQVSHVYTKYHRRWLLKSLLEIVRMRMNHYDLVIDTMDIRFGKILMLLLINADWLIANTGYERRYGLDNSDITLYHRINKWRKIHTTERLLEFLRLLDIEDYEDTMEFPLAHKEISFAKSYLKPYADYKLIGLNADASSQARSILDSEIIEICSGIGRRDSNIRILLFSSKARYRHMKALAKNAKLDNVILEEGTSDIFDAAALASFMKVMISPDTSFIHIASAFDIPTVAIYPNDPDHLKYWGPRSGKHIVIQPVKADNSIRGFSVADTISATIKLLDDTT